MPLIEGLGDEVTLVMATLLVCVIVTLAWFSTHTADLPALREVGITVIERTQIRRRVIAQPPSNQDRPVDNENLTGLIEFVSRPPGNTSESSQDRGISSESSQEAGATAAADERVELSQHTPPPSDTNSAKEGATETISASTLLKDRTSELKSLVQQPSETKSTEDHHGDHEEEIASSKLTSSAVSPAENTLKPVVSTQSVEQPSEEEVRRRRVQFFQNSSSPQATRDAALGVSSSENNGATDSSKSETSNSPAIASSGDQSSDDCLHKHIRVNNTDSASTSVAQPQQSSSTTRSSDADSNTQEARQSSPSIRVKLKYMNETQRMVYTSPLDTIGNFRRTHFQQELQEGDKWVRFIYNGQDLRDDEATLQAYQVGDNCTMHCLITNKRRAPSAQGGSSGSGGGLHAGDDEEGDSVMGALMYPLFTLVLAVVWYFRLTYRQYFSPMSTVCLIGISFLLGLGYFSSLRTTAAATGNQQQTPSGTSEQPEQRPNNRATATGHAHSD